jgi:hypothetical protein
MGRRRLAFIVVITLAVLTLVGALIWKRRIGRPGGVPATAVLVDGRYMDCIQMPSGFGEPCKVYDGTSGKLVDTNPFLIRLGAFSKEQGGSPTDCGRTSSKAPDAKVAECVQAAFKRHSPFTAQYITDLGPFTYAYGIAGNADGKVAEATYDSRGFPNVAPNKRRSSSMAIKFG